MTLFIIIVLLVGAVGYVRLAPTDFAKWHVPVTEVANKDMMGGVFRVISASEDDLQRFHQIALQTENTDHIAGHPDDGHVTYRTRTKWIGFPDFTTVQHVDGQLRIHGRLRFGKADLGVNKTRVDAWLAQLKN